MLREVLKVFSLAHLIITYDEVVKHHRRITSMRSSPNVYKRSIF